MKMKKILPILIIVTLGASCTSDRMSVPEGTVRTWSATGQGLSWLVREQRPNGYWGTDDRRVALTSLATLAFLYQGESPASPDYGKTIEKALRALLRDATDTTDLDPTDRALLTWCLAEAYGLTKIPLLVEPVEKLAAALDISSPSPWHAFAAHAVFLSGASPDTAKRILARLQPAYAKDTDSRLGQATHLLVMLWTGDWKNSTPYLEHLRRQDPGQWRTGNLPLQTAAVLSLTLFSVGGKDWTDWNRRFYPELVRSQIVKKELGWWTPECLGVGKSTETSGMSSDDARIYTTSLMMLTLHQRRILPSFRPAVEDDGHQIEDEDEIDIEIHI
jgi:hypothetical protein